MQGSHLPLLTWAQAIYLVTSSSKGISAVKLGEMLGVSNKTAWFLGHRIREMMSEREVLLSGFVEIDEAYAGAPPRKKSKSGDNDDQDGGSTKTGRWTDRPMLLVAAERHGPVVTKTIPTHSKAAMKVALEGMLSDRAVAMTDGLSAYARQSRREFQFLSGSRHLGRVPFGISQASGPIRLGMRVPLEPQGRYLPCSDG